MDRRQAIRTLHGEAAGVVLTRGTSSHERESVAAPLQRSHAPQHSPWFGLGVQGGDKISTHFAEVTEPPCPFLVYSPYLCSETDILSLKKYLF